MRTGMIELVSELRLMTDTADDTGAVYGRDYWTDDDLQATLDLFRQPFEERLVPWKSYVSGMLAHVDYYYTPAWVERAGTGVEAWSVSGIDGVLYTVNADYTVNYNARHIRFAADTGGRVIVVRGRSYALYAAAAHIWSQRAALVASRFDVQTDNHELKRSQLIAHARQMAAHYAALDASAASGMHRMRRVDVN